MNSPSVGQTYHLSKIFHKLESLLCLETPWSVFLNGILKDFVLKTNLQW
jgi:hypothetical protein